MAGIPAMSQKIIFAMMSGRDTLIRDISKNNYNRIGIDEIKEAFDRGDEAVVEVVDENAARLAFGINSIINLFSPEAVVIGGEITKLGEAYLERVRMCVRDIGFKSSIGKVDIRYSSNPDNSVTLGGAKYVLDNVFRQVSFPDAGDIDVAIYKAGG